VVVGDRVVVGHLDAGEPRALEDGSDFEELAHHVRMLPDGGTGER